jgi:hypothetical protein
MWWAQPAVLSLLISGGLAVANPHGPVSAAPATTTLQATLTSSSTVQAKSPAPSNCRKLSTDSDWPTDDVWKSELPGIEKVEPNQKAKHPDWNYDAKTVQHVQKAVKFAAKHNVRLTIINTGHDFMNRYGTSHDLLEMHHFRYSSFITFTALRIVSSFLSC